MLAAFYVGKFVEINSDYLPTEELGQTMAFLVLGWSSILHIFTVRSRKSIFKRRIRDNMPLVYAVLAMIVLFAIMIAVPPIGRIFGLVPISGYHWMIVVGLSVVPTIIAEIVKWKDNMEDMVCYRRRLVRHFSKEE